MKKGITAAALGVGLVFTGGACTGEYVPPPPTPFAGSVSNKPESCPGGRGQQMPSIPLTGEMTQRADLTQIARNTDIRLQTSMCKTAIRIGKALLDAVNHPNPESDFSISVNQTGNGYKEIWARKKGDKGGQAISAAYTLSSVRDASKPAEVTSVYGFWNPDGGGARLAIDLKRFNVSEGGSGWQMRVDRLEVEGSGERIDPVIDPSKQIGTLAEFDVQADKTASTLLTLGHIPMPPSFVPSQTQAPATTPSSR